MHFAPSSCTRVLSPNPDVPGALRHLTGRNVSFGNRAEAAMAGLRVKYTPGIKLMHGS